MKARTRNGFLGGLPPSAGAHAVALLAVCVLAAAPLPAPAQLVSFTAEATVFSLDDTHGLLDGSVAIGSPLHATIVYDATVPDLWPGDPVEGFYPQSVPPALFRVEVGNYVIEAPASGLAALVVDDGLFGDIFRTIVEGTTFPFPGVSGASINLLDFLLVDPSGTALAGKSLPPAPPALAAFQNKQITIGGCRDDEVTGFLCPSPTPLGISATITSLPEPGAASLGAAAFLALAAQGARWRRGRPAKRAPAR